VNAVDPRAAALCRALGLGDDPAKILDALSQLYSDLDRALGERARGLDLPCRAGCDACCHESVFLSAPEFFAVAVELLATHTLETRTRIVEEMRALAVRFEDELELLETLTPGDERDEVAARIKFRCPLLAADGRCTVYRARELNARTFGQSWDAFRHAAYGCELTHARLRVLPETAGPALFDAREARRRLVAAVPRTELVHVYPWWFARHGDALL
jgi:hypothetical protein